MYLQTMRANIYFSKIFTQNIERIKSIFVLLNIKDMSSFRIFYPKQLQSMNGWINNKKIRQLYI